MFNKYKFSKILNNIYKTYNNQREFAEATGVNRAYLSQYINQKLDNPPSPKVLEKIADASKGLIDYIDLMQICGYIDLLTYENIRRSNTNKVIKDFYPVLTELGLNQKDIDFFETSLSNDKADDFLILIDSIPDDKKEKAYKILNDIMNTIADKSNKDSLFLKNKTYNSSPQYYMCPVYGHISAGQPNWAEECIEGRIPIDPELMNIVNPEECFFLRVNGESMNKIVKNGAYALIRKTDFVENGEIAVVLVNGYDATLKKFSRQGDLVILEPQSTDSSYETQVYGKETEVKIIGKYIGKMEMK